MIDIIRNFFTPENWVFTGSDAIQILLSVIGFLIAYIQLNKSKKSIDAAKDASKKTLDKIQNNFSLVESTEIASDIKSLKEHLNSEKFDIAHYLTTVIPIKLKKLSQRKEYINDDRKFEIEKMILYISKLEEILLDHEKKQKSFELTKVNIRLSEIIRDLYGWVELTKFEQGENNGRL